MSELLPGIKRHALPYADYRRNAQDCDILLWEPRNFYSGAVARGTDGPFSHASLAVKLERRLWDLGFDERSGGVGRPLSGIVRRNRGKISVFRVRGEFDRAGMRETFIRDMSQTPRYNWGGILLIVICRMIGIRFLPRCQKWFEKRIRQHGMFCSQSIQASAVTSNGVYFTRMPSWKVTPNDLARSSALDYLGTLD